MGRKRVDKYSTSTATATCACVHTTFSKRTPVRPHCAHAARLRGNFVRFFLRLFYSSASSAQNEDEERPGQQGKGGERESDQQQQRMPCAVRLHQRHKRGKMEREVEEDGDAGWHPAPPPPACADCAPKITTPSEECVHELARSPLLPNCCCLKRGRSRSPAPFLAAMHLTFLDALGCMCTV